MNYKEAREQLIWNVRLDFDPVGVRFVSDEDEIEKLPVSHKAKARLTYCQFLTAVRQERFAVFMEAKKCLCENAAPVFGFRELEKEADAKRHLKYLVDPDTSWRAPREKAKLELGKCKGIYMAPLDWFDKMEYAPDLVFIMGTPYQAYHLLNDYMGSRKLPNLSFFHTPNSAVCAGGVYAYNNKTANMTTMCAGSKTSGKTEMGYVNLFIPGEHFLSMVDQQKMRCEKGGPSVLGKGYKPWPGLDACKGCPLFKFEPVG
ncbi:MAG: DUF169 domain-containing protein [Desulfobacterales bacterium]|nr:DUF169 domain-containing protein [Desulfobacterales bacterium]